MGLAAFNRMRREQAERESKKQEVEKQPEQENKLKSPNDALTVPQIKEKLEALKIEFAKSGKKDELLILLDAAEVNQNQQNNQSGDQNQGADQSQDENKQPE